jgi:hypothetical protein
MESVARGGCLNLHFRFSHCVSLISVGKSLGRSVQNSPNKEILKHCF